MDQALLHLTVLSCAAVLLGLAAWTDAHHYRIPNRICLALLLLFPALVLTSPHEIDWAQHAMTFALVLGAGMALFALRVAGAGDIKLLAVTGLWAGPHFLALFLCVTALAGGLLGLAMAILTHRRNLRRAPHQAVAVAHAPIPYGIAIAVGGLSILMMLSHPALNVL